MATKIPRLRSQLTQSYTKNASAFRAKWNIVQTRLDQIAIPERFKGTVVEKWLRYWRGLCIDYGDVFANVGQQMKKKPIRASIYASLIAATWYCARHNPSETEFFDRLRKYNAEMILVNPVCHKPTSVEHLIFVERSLNEGIIRKLNLGVCTLLWLDNYDKSVALYQATCTYTQPDYLTWHKRVIEVGFLDKWWTLEEKMVDYDVNENNIQM